MMEAVRPPLEHIKERQVGATRPPAMHRDCLGGEALLGALLILAGILATSDCNTQCVVGLPGNVTHDGGCEVSFGTYKGKASGSYPASGHAS